MKLAQATMEEFRKAVKKGAILVVPFGTVEAHGTHLPLDTDTLVIREVAEKAAERDGRLIVAPAVGYGVCTSTSQHPGTMGISTAALRLISTDIVRGAYFHGLRKVVLVSGHGGGLHVSALREAAEGLAAELKGLKIAAFSIYDVLSKEARALSETKNDSHAGEMETSLVLYLAPGLVRGRAREEYPSFPSPVAVKDKLKYWKGAVWGDPKKATGEKGRRLFELMVDALEGVISRLDKV